MAESGFTTRCTRCDECVRACPTGVIRAGDGGFPRMAFEQAHCTFCGDCAAACDTGAIDRRDGAEPWDVRARIGAQCLCAQNVVCRSCEDSCAEAAIRFRPRLRAAAMPEIVDGACTGCGACVAACPTQAIAITQAAPQLEAA